jgi:hypothetical protein
MMMIGESTLDSDWSERKQGWCMGVDEALPSRKSRKK